MQSHKPNMETAGGSSKSIQTTNKQSANVVHNQLLNYKSQFTRRIESKLPSSLTPRIPDESDALVHLSGTPAVPRHFLDELRMCADANHAFCQLIAALEEY